MTKALKMKSIHLYSLGKGTRGNGTFQNVSGETGNFILWEAGHLNLWERLDHITSWNRTTFPLGSGTSSGNRDMGNGTRFPLGFGPLIPWETYSGNREFGNLFFHLLNVLAKMKIIVETYCSQCKYVKILLCGWMSCKSSETEINTKLYRLKQNSIN